MSIRVAVVGGGATGVGVARDLALRGVAVTLLERGGLGAGTTGRSHGLLHSGARYATADPDSAIECIGENRVLREIAAPAIADTGGLFVDLPGDVGFEERLIACRDVGIPAEELSAEDARSLEPELTDAVERAFRVPDGVVVPSRLVAANAESARRAGAEIRTETPVTDIRLDGNRVVGVETDCDSIPADHVVNAAGAWAGEIAAMAELNVPMAPTKGVMVTVGLPGVNAVLNRCRPPGDGDIAVPRDGCVVLGTTSTAVDSPDEFTREEAAIDRVLAEGAEMLPAVADAAVDLVYWGVRPLYGGEADRGRSASRGFRVLDHADDGRPGMTSVIGGKLTTYRLMAEAVADDIASAYGVDAPCQTREEPLPGETAADLDAFVRRFDAAGPADAAGPDA